MARDSQIQRESRQPYKKHKMERRTYEKARKIPGKRGNTESGRSYRIVRTRVMRRIGKIEVMHYPLPSEVREYFALMES